MPLLPLIYFLSASKMCKEALRDRTKEVTCWIMCNQDTLYYINLINYIIKSRQYIGLFFHILLSISDPFMIYL